MKVGNLEIQINKLDNKGWMGWICVCVCGGGVGGGVCEDEW
jgi:hypothetical protein